MDLCLVAMGAAVDYPHCWDLAGGVVIETAGGEFDVMARRVLAAATPDLLCQIVHADLPQQR